MFLTRETVLKIAGTDRRSRILLHSKKSIEFRCLVNGEFLSFTKLQWKKNDMAHISGRRLYCNEVFISRV